MLETLIILTHPYNTTALEYFLTLLIFCNHDIRLIAYFRQSKKSLSSF